MLEKTIENKIKAYLESNGFYYIKVHGSGFMPKGIPDIIACVNGQFLGIEVKATGKKKQQSPYQKIHQKMIEKANGRYILVDTVKEVEDYIEKL